jgi:hypothetical protein
LAIAMLGAADHVVEQALAHRRLANAHLADVERRETRFEDRDAAREHADAIVGEAGQAQLVDAAAGDDRVADAPQRDARDAGLAPTGRLRDRADRLDRARRADRLVPALRAIVRRELLQLDRDLGLRAMPAFRTDLAVFEEAQRARDTAHLQAFLLDRLEMLADDEFGAAAADVDHEPPFGRLRDAVGDAEIDQARLFATGHDLDRMSERFFRGA